MVLPIKVKLQIRDVMRAPNVQGLGATGCK